MDVRDDTTTGNGGLDQSIQFFVSSNGQLQVTGSDTLHLQVFARISSQFQYFCRQVFQNGGRIDGRCRSDTVSLVHGVLQETMHTTYGELKTGLGTS